MQTGCVEANSVIDDPDAYRRPAFKSLHTDGAAAHFRLQSVDEGVLHEWLDAESRKVDCFRIVKLAVYRDADQIVETVVLDESVLPDYFELCPQGNDACALFQPVPERSYPCPRGA